MQYIFSYFFTSLYNQMTKHFQKKNQIQRRNKFKSIYKKNISLLLKEYFHKNAKNILYNILHGLSSLLFTRAFMSIIL